MDKAYQDYRDFLYVFFIKHVKIKSLAEDLAQDVFIKFWQKRDEIHSLENIDAWLFTLAKNHLNDHYRRLATEKKYQSAVWQEMERHSNTVIRDIYKKELEEEIQALLETLPPRQREIYVLSRQQGMSLEEIGQTLDLSPNTVKNHLVKALKVVRGGLSAAHLIQVFILLEMLYK
ncbi:RNA polymerase sigma-70 factor [Membranihabitans marinus]|uniref:RNA polymerase sigma-70 factor n=1 Tax=Membranihabitans marinus TaxID=1227546 RepID=UPI001F01F4FD|nr:RNA polymerase sigma-70 factor [Membranihabitans marinus]